MKTEISEMKDTLEEIKGRLNEADDQISIMEYKVKKCSIREIKRKKLSKRGRFKKTFGQN